MDVVRCNVPLKLVVSGFSLFASFFFSSLDLQSCMHLMKRYVCDSYELSTHNGVCQI